VRSGTVWKCSDSTLPAQPARSGGSSKEPQWPEPLVCGESSEVHKRRSANAFSGQVRSAHVHRHTSHMLCSSESRSPNVAPPSASRSGQGVAGHKLLIHRLWMHRPALPVLTVASAVPVYLKVNFEMLAHLSLVESPSAQAARTRGSDVGRGLIRGGGVAGNFRDDERVSNCGVYHHERSQQQCVRHNPLVEQVGPDKICCWTGF